ncbi:MAG: low affinity iron permease family protein [Thermomicrobiales bacterium]
MAKWFAAFSRKASAFAGHYLAFVVAVAFVAVWAVSGPFFGFSETWQLVINTSTTIITFLMVFLVQSTQNRDSEAMHIKLDEIISALKETNDRVLDAEDQTEDDLDEEKQRYEAKASDTAALSRP